MRGISGRDTARWHTKPARIWDNRDVSNPSGRRWRLNSDGQVEPEDGSPVGSFNGQEWRAQEWPSCPVCGSTDAEPERIEVRHLGDQFPVFVIGAWECPNDCDPRPVLRGEAQ
jgi:hypothetical protein